MDYSLAIRVLMNSTLLDPDQRPVKSEMATVGGVGTSLVQIRVDQNSNAAAESVFRFSVESRLLVRAAPYRGATARKRSTPELKML